MAQAFCQQFWQNKLRGFLEIPVWNAAGLAVPSEEVWQSLRCLEAKEVTDRSHPLEHLIPAEIVDCPDAQKVFWWFWRCFPQTIANANNANNANANDTSANQCSIAGDPQFYLNWDWSHASVTAALAGARAGYLATRTAGATPNQPERQSHPHLALFKFTPVFDLVQTSQTEQEVWAGAWISHYLAAKICWRIARKYGPDTFLSPCLYAHPWIDYWLLQYYPDFGQWIATPTPEARVQSQFSNTLMMILPDNGASPTVAKHHPVWATMIYAEQTLKQEWLALSQQIVTSLHTPQIEWQVGDLKRKEQWLEASWQPYWVALPIPNDRPPAEVAAAEVAASETTQSTPSTLDSSTPVQLTSSQSSPIPSSLLQHAHSCLQRLEHSRLWKLPTLFSCNSAPSEAQSTSVVETQQETEQAGHQDVHQNINQFIQRKLPSILPDLLAVELKELNQCVELPAFGWRVLVQVNWKRSATAQQYGDSATELTAAAAFNRSLLAFSEQYLPELMHRHHAKLLWSTPGCLMASLSLQNWQDWVAELQQGWEKFRMLGQPPIQQQLHRSSFIEVSLVMADVMVPLPLVLHSLRCNQPLDAVTIQSPRSHPQDLDMIQVQVFGRTHPARCARASFAAWQEWRSLLKFRPANLATCTTAPSYLQFLRLLQQTSSTETFDQEVQNWLHLAVSNPACEVL